MANLIYNFGLESFGNGDISWRDDNIKAAIVDTDTYTVSAEHQYISQVSGIIARSANFTNKTNVGGILDADDAVFSSVTGTTGEAVIIFKDTGNDATSILICYIDSGTGLPVTPNGNNIIVCWSNTTNKILKI